MQNSPIVERFLRYARIDTRAMPADPDTKEGRDRRGYPSCPGQVELTKLLKEELEDMGLDAIEHQLLDLEDGSFMVILPATTGFERAPHLVYATHMDTHHTCSGKVAPIIHTYEGGDLVVNASKGIIIPASKLEGLEGKQIITSDGTSLLGADNKAGVAGSMQTISNIIVNQLPHGPLTFWFCTDEEVGELDLSFVLEKIAKSWDIFATPDGERLDATIDTGCLVLRWIRMNFTGQGAHPGVGAADLRPAQMAAYNFATAMGLIFRTPKESSGLQPAVYIEDIEGGAKEASLMCKVLSFNQSEATGIARQVVAAVRTTADKWGVKVQWNNVLKCINPRELNDRKPELIAPGIAALEKIIGKPVQQTDIRGGTDGAMAMMLYRHLVTFCFGTGAFNLHGDAEGLVVPELEELPDVMGEMIDQYKDVQKTS